ncbi:MAG: HAD family hydrolase [Acidimicrobiia bacterium]|jgi:phosphoserine phosphatase
MLESWNDTPTRAAIEGYVASVTAHGPGFIPPEERVAVFDNDGTLWSEKPIPIQLDFALFRMAAMAAADPALQEQQPWKAAFETDMKWLGEAMVKHYHGDDGDMTLLLQAVPRTIADLSIEDYDREVTTFFEQSSHPVLKRPYRDCGYAPMVELLRYLEENGFTPYIASGGDRDFMRPIAGHIYGIPPERIIGSSQALDFQEREDGNDVLYKSEMEFFDDGPTKPVRIWSRIGRRPVVAGGNSNGDIQMLRFANHPRHPGLRTLLLHDDAEREFDYTAGAEDALARAADKGWTVISIKDDWSTVFGEKTP